METINNFFWLRFLLTQLIVNILFVSLDKPWAASPHLKSVTPQLNTPKSSQDWSQKSSTSGIINPACSGIFTIWEVDSSSFPTNRKHQRHKHIEFILVITYFHIPLLYSTLMSTTSPESCLYCGRHRLIRGCVNGEMTSAAYCNRNKPLSLKALFSGYCVHEKPSHWKTSWLLVSDFVPCLVVKRKKGFMVVLTTGERDENQQRTFDREASVCCFEIISLWSSVTPSKRRHVCNSYLTKSNPMASIQTWTQTKQSWVQQKKWRPTNSSSFILFFVNFCRIDSCFFS